MFCEKCGAMIEDGSSFCPQCGQKIEDSEQKKTALKIDKKKEKKEKKKFPLIPILAGVVFIAVIISAVIISLKMLKPKESVIYLKSNDIYALDGKKSYEMGGKSFYKNENDFVLAYLYTGLNYNMTLSDDEKYIYYPASIEPKSFDLYCRQYGKKDAEAIKIASNVWKYEVLPDNSVIYLDCDSYKLYLWDMKKQEKEKIDSEVGDFEVSDDGESLLIYQADDEKMQCSIQDTALKHDKEKVFSYSIGERPFVSGDFNIMVCKDEHKLYLSYKQGEKTKVATDVVDWFVIEEDNAIYYLKEDVQEITYMDVIEDDFAKQDEKITEPDIKDYQHEEVVPSFWGSRTETVTDDAYYDDYQKYREKLERDAVRDSFQNQPFMISTQVLYRYDIEKGESEKLAENVYDVRWSFQTSSFMYNTVDYQTIDKLKLSELTSYDYSAIDETVQREMRDKCEVFVCSDKKIYEIERDRDEFASGLQIGFITTVSDNTAYFLVYDDSVKQLWSASLEGKSHKMRLVQEDYSDIEIMTEDGIYYMVDVDNNGDGDLYYNDEKIASDVAQYSVKPLQNEQDILYLADRTNQYMEGDLMLYNGKKSVKIASDALNYVSNEAGDIAYLTNYNWKKHRGDMQIYKNGKVIDAEEDVEAILYY